MPVSIRLPKELEDRLAALANRTGRSKTWYIRQALEEHIEEMEEVYLAEQTLWRIREGLEDTVPLEDLVKQHGVEARKR